VKQKVIKIRDTIRSAIKFDRNKINFMQVMKVINKKNMTQDEFIILVSFCIIVVALFASALIQIRPKKTTDSFEFEVDNEAVPVEDSKKTVDKTLKNIMEKNNARTTIQV